MKPNPQHRWPNIIAAFLMVLGLTRMAGYWMDNRLLQGIGAASGIAPFTKVFSATEGYEAFTASFVIRGNNAAGESGEIHLTPQVYAQLNGPYMRRNVYGAALVFAPRLPERLREQLHSQALRPESPLRKELHVPAEWTSATLIIRPREGSGLSPWTYQIPCQ